MSIFPSVEWFDDIREIYNSDDSFQSGGGGALEAEIGIKIGDQIFQLSFTGEKCVDTHVINDDALIDLDFY